MQQTPMAFTGTEVHQIGGFPKAPRKPENYVEQMYADADEVSDQMLKETMEIIGMLGKAPLIHRINEQGYEEFVIPKEMAPRDRLEYYRTVFADDRATIAWISSHSVQWAIEAMQDYLRLQKRFENV